MVDASILGRVADYYSDKVRQHGETARGVDWNSTESQKTRFDRLLEIVPPGTPVARPSPELHCRLAAHPRGRRVHDLDVDVQQCDLVGAGARGRPPEGFRRE